MPRTPLPVAAGPAPGQAHPGRPDARALLAWAQRVRVAAGQVHDVASQLRRSRSRAGLVGPAGDALRVLLDRRLISLGRLEHGYEDVARRLAAEAAQAATCTCTGTGTGTGWAGKGR